MSILSFRCRDTELLYQGARVARWGNIDRAGQHSIRINDQWRVCFVWADDGAHGVEIVDYHKRSKPMAQVKPVSPGEMLQEEFLKPLGLTAYRLAKDIRVPVTRVYDIVAGKRAITAETDLLLCRYFGLSAGWWLALQSHQDIQVARRALGKRLDKILRCPLLDLNAAH